MIELIAMFTVGLGALEQQPSEHILMREAGVSMPVAEAEAEPEPAPPQPEPAPEPAPEPPPAPAEPPAEARSHSVDWDALARCESGYGGEPRWGIDVHDHRGAYDDARFYGGLQFNKSSWDWAVEVGGHAVPYWPHHATREQQIEVAETLLDIHPAGLGAWPACTRKLGWR